MRPSTPLLRSLPLLAVLVAALALAAIPATAPAKSPTRPGAAGKPAKPAKRVRTHAHHGPLAHTASCGPTMTGDWHNIDPNTRSMTRAIVDYTCDDVRLCDTDGHCTGGDSYYSMHVFGRCHPTDCDWGRLRATDMGNGWIRSIYSFGFVTSHVWLKTYQYYGRTYLRVWTFNDFPPSDGRSDYTTDEWMLR